MAVVHNNPHVSRHGADESACCVNWEVLWYKSVIVLDLDSSVIYTNLTVVCESVTGRSTEAIRPARKSFVSLHRWTWTLHQTAH